VATPLDWDELSDRRLRAQGWTIRTVLDRDPDVWKGVRRAAGALPRL
jgi:DNA primase